MRVNAAGGGRSFPLPHGIPRADDRRIVSCIIYVIRGGLMWRDAPKAYGPHKTIYNRFIRWSRLGGYDANSLRKTLRENGTSPVIPGRRNRKRAIRYDRQRYRSRHLIENAFCRIKDFRRVATRYDKLAANFLSAVALATAIAFWL
ncbi:MAG: transposase [Sphingomonas sp.]|nr:transposase [Sphingomonas sp.]